MFLNPKVRFLLELAVPLWCGWLFSPFPTKWIHRYQWKFPLVHLSGKASSNCYSPSHKIILGSPNPRINFSFYNRRFNSLTLKVLSLCYRTWSNLKSVWAGRIICWAHRKSVCNLNSFSQHNISTYNAHFFLSSLKQKFDCHMNHIGPKWGVKNLSTICRGILNLLGFLKKTSNMFYLIPIEKKKRKSRFYWH